MGKAVKISSSYTCDSLAKGLRGQSFKGQEDARTQKGYERGKKISAESRQFGWGRKWKQDWTLWVVSTRKWSS